MKLSPTMQAALDCARANGGKLELWPCGDWTYAGCPARIANGVFRPDRPFTWGTIKALIERGLLRSSSPGKYVVEVEVVS